MKANVIYRSMRSDRLWIKLDGELKTRLTSDEYWHPAGWPQPEMTERDLDFYIERGEMSE